MLITMILSSFRSQHVDQIRCNKQMPGIPYFNFSYYEDCTSVVLARGPLPTQELLEAELWAWALGLLHGATSRCNRVGAFSLRGEQAYLTANTLQPMYSDILLQVKPF